MPTKTKYILRLDQIISILTIKPAPSYHLAAIYLAGHKVKLFNDFLFHSIINHLQVFASVRLYTHFHKH